MARINNKQREFCRLIVEEGFQSSTAYREVYNPDMKHQVSNSAAYNLLRQEPIQRYIKHLQELVKNKYSIDKNGIIKNHLKLIGWFEEMYELADKETLTEDESSRFRRLSTLLKGSDYNKTQDMLAKMMGSYEPEKIEVKQEIKLSFGDDDNDDDEDEYDGD